MAGPQIRGVVAPVVTTGAVTSHASTAIGDLIAFFVWSQGAVAANITHTVTDGTYFKPTNASWAHDDGTTDGRLTVIFKEVTVAGAQSYTPTTPGSATTNGTLIMSISYVAGTWDRGVLTNGAAPCGFVASTSTNNSAPASPNMTRPASGDIIIHSVAAWHLTTNNSAVATLPSGLTTLQGQTPTSPTHLGHLAVGTRYQEPAAGGTESFNSWGDNVTPNGTAAMAFYIAAPVVISGTSTPTLGALTLSSDGDVVVKADAAITLGALTVAADGDVVVKADAAITLEALTATSTGGTAVHVDATLAALTATSTAQAIVSGVSTIALDDVASSAAGVVGVDGAAAPTLDALTAAAAGVAVTHGAAAMQFADVASSAAGIVGIDGAAAIALEDVTSSAAVRVVVDGAIEGELSALSVISGGAVIVQGAADAQLGALTSQATGSAESNSTSGTASITLDDVQIVSAGVAVTHGSASPQLGDVTGASTGAVVVGADAAITLDALTASSAGVVITHGDAAITLADVTSSAAGAVGIDGAAAMQLEALTLGAGAASRVHGVAAIDLGALTADAVLSTQMIVRGAVEITLEDVHGHSPVAEGMAIIMGGATIALGEIGLISEGTAKVKAAAELALNGLFCASIAHRIINGVLIEVTAVLDDGTRPAKLSAQSRQAITIRQGEDTTIRVTLVNVAGVPIVLDAADHLAFSARTVPSPVSKKLFVKTSIASPRMPSNRYDIQIPSADTRAITATHAVYDVVVVRAGGGRDIVMAASQLVIARSVGDMANLP